MLKRRLLLTILLAFAAFIFTGTAMAAPSVGWLTPPDNSSYLTGTTLPEGTITGQASASGGSVGTGLDLALIIDESGSMGTTKMQQAKDAAKALVNALPENTTSVAVIGFDSYSHTYRVLTALNPDKQLVLNAINSIYAGGGTNIGSGIARGTSVLLAGHTTGRQMMQVVLSDGYGSYSGQAATAYNNHGIITHTVGVPGHSVSLMQQIATQGHGVYTNVSNMATLQGIFDGTGGNLVGIDHVDIEFSDGTWIYDIAIDGLGNFILPDWVVKAGVQTFTAHAYDTNQVHASAVLTINGSQVPEPATMALFGLGLLGFAGVARRKN